jgi:amidase
VLTGTAADAAEVTWEALEPRTRRQARAGQVLAAARRLARVGEEPPASVRDRCVEWFAATRTDALLTPALAAPPPKIGAWRGRGFIRTLVASAQFMPFSPLANLAGLPAIAVPAGVDARGLPVGVQLLGPPGSEGVLLELAATLERVRPWPRHAPLAGS